MDPSIVDFRRTLSKVSVNGSGSEVTTSIRRTIKAHQTIGCDANYHWKCQRDGEESQRRPLATMLDFAFEIGADGALCMFYAKHRIVGALFQRGCPWGHHLHKDTGYLRLFVYKTMIETRVD